LARSGARWREAALAGEEGALAAEEAVLTREEAVLAAEERHFYEHDRDGFSDRHAWRDRNFFT
jgi:hypothetical protein